MTLQRHVDRLRSNTIRGMLAFLFSGAGSAVFILLRPESYAIPTAIMALLLIAAHFLLWQDSLRTLRAIERENSTPAAPMAPAPVPAHE